MPGPLKLVTAPLLVIRPMEPGPHTVVAPAAVVHELELLVNHSAPSGPATIPVGSVMLGSVKLFTTPRVVIRPMELWSRLANHKAPSGPGAIPSGREMPGPVKLVAFPVVVIRPIEGPPSANHNAPSHRAIDTGQSAIPKGREMLGSVKL